MAIQSGSFWRNVRISRKLAAIPAVFIAAITTILLYALASSQDQLSDSLVVDMAGRQRTLLYRHLAEVTQTTAIQTTSRVENSTPMPAAAPHAERQREYDATRKTLTDSLASLLNGGPVTIALTGQVLELPAAPTAEVRAGLLEERQSLDAYFAKVDELLKLAPADARVGAALQAAVDASDKADVEANEVVKLFTAHSRSKISATIQWQAAIGGLVALCGCALSWLIARGIVAGLARVVAVAQRIAQGDLRVEKLSDVSNDEVGTLAGVFNEMLDTLRDLTGQTVAVTGNLNSAAAEILASTQQQAASAKQQAATVQEIAGTMDEVKQSGSQVTERAQQVAAVAEATSENSASGLKAVQETNTTMESIREQVEEVAENIVALSEKTQAVGDIISTVNEIAERSNLLALNAAIEAAAAGDHGNRFSVVASEIKNLADQAKDSTVQVRTILGDIQKGINSSVMLTEEAVKRVETGKQRADVAEQTIRQMAGTTTESIQAFQQIIGATGQQQIGISQVSQGMQDIRQAASQTAASTIQLEKAVASLNAQSQQLRAAVGRYQL